MVIVDAENVEEVASQVDFCFCAVNMKKDEIRDLEDRYAKAECPIVSNNSAIVLQMMFLWLFLKLTPITLRLLTLRESVSAQKEALLQLSQIAHFRAMFLQFIH